jgi:hypothetical protein
MPGRWELAQELLVFGLKSTLTNNNNSRVVSGMRPGTKIVPAKSAQKRHIHSEG